MGTAPGNSKTNKPTRVALCVGLGIFLGLFAIAAFAFFAPCMDDGPMRSQAVDAKFRELAAKLETYRMDAGDYPSREQGLAALAARPVDYPENRKWRPQFRHVPKDPWGQEYRYHYPARDGDWYPEIVSGGADMKIGTEDDYSSAALE